MKNSQLLLRCSKCNSINQNDIRNDGFVAYRYCTICGEVADWKNSSERWVSVAKWWNPKTWFDGYWEKKL